MVIMGQFKGGHGYFLTGQLKSELGYHGSMVGEWSNVAVVIVYNFICLIRVRPCYL